MNFDVGFKLIFIEGYLGNADFDYASTVYKKSAECLDNYQEDRFQEEINSFVNLIDCCNSKNAECLNKKCKFMSSSHYMALELFFNLKFKRDYQDNNNFDFKYFEMRGLNKEYIEFAVYTLLKYSLNCFIFFVWPSTSKMINQRNKAAELIENNFNVIYKKTIKLGFNHFYQLLFLLYHKFEWIQNCLNAFNSDFVDKVYKCFGKGGDIKILFLMNDEPKKVLNLKRGDLRDCFSLGLHSIHSCDGKDEVMPISRLLLNDNSQSLFKAANFKKNYEMVCSLLNFYMGDYQYLPAEASNIVLGNKVEHAPDKTFLMHKNGLSWGEVAYFYNLRIEASNKKYRGHVPSYKKYLYHYLWIKKKSKISNKLNSIIYRKK